VPLIRLIFRERFAAAPIGLRGDNQPNERAKVVVLLDEEIRESIEQRFIAGRIRDPQIVHGLDQAEALEPAHYYHRQHEKSANETYSRADALNRLVDALPAENLLGRDLLEWVEIWGKTGDKQAANALRKQFERWLANNLVLQQLLDSRIELKALKTTADNINSLSVFAVQSLDVCESGQRLSESQLKAASALFDVAQQLDQEMVISPLSAVQKMVQIAANCP
jgi:hexosaminidase